MLKVKGAYAATPLDGRIVGLAHLTVGRVRVVMFNDCADAGVSKSASRPRAGKREWDEWCGTWQYLLYRGGPTVGVPGVTPTDAGTAPFESPVWLT